MEQGIFKNVLDKTLSSYGFRKEKANYCKECSDTIIIVDLQSSGVQGGFYINYGFFVTKLHYDIEEATLLSCDFASRFTMEDNSSVFFPDKLSVDEYKIIIEDNIEKHISPFLAEDIGNSFALYP